MYPRVSRSPITVSIRRSCGRRRCAVILAGSEGNDHRLANYRRTVSLFVIVIGLYLWLQSSLAKLTVTLQVWQLECTRSRGETPPSPRFGPFTMSLALGLA
jgi:hypothetical protein